MSCRRGGAAGAREPAAAGDPRAAPRPADAMTAGGAAPVRTVILAPGAAPVAAAQPLASSAAVSRTGTSSTSPPGTRIAGGRVTVARMPYRPAGQGCSGHGGRPAEPAWPVHHPRPAVHRPWQAKPAKSEPVV